MEERTKSTSNLAQGAADMIDSATEAAEEKVEETTQRLGNAVERAREMLSSVTDTACDYAKATDKAVRDYPYQAIGIALGLGALVGCLLTRGNSCQND